MIQLSEVDLASELRAIVEDENNDAAEAIYNKAVDVVRDLAHKRKTRARIHLIKRDRGDHESRSQKVDSRLYNVKCDKEVFRLLKARLRKDGLTVSIKEVSRPEHKTRYVYHAQYKTTEEVRTSEYVPDGYVLDVSWTGEACVIV